MIEKAAELITFLGNEVSNWARGENKILKIWKNSLFKWLNSNADLSSLELLTFKKHSTVQILLQKERKIMSK